MVIIYAGVNGFLDKLPVNKVGEFEKAIIPFVKSQYPELIDGIKKDGKISDDMNKKLKDTIMPNFLKTFAA